MDIFELVGHYGHEQVVFWSEPSIGYKGIIALHDTSLGPALGGTRFWQYADERSAVVDALRLSRGMTYKAAVAGLNLGGGKSVIIGDNQIRDREMIFRAHGRAVESLGGRYITAEDVGVSVYDMEYVRMETSHCAGLLGRSGDPSPVTAWGVFMGIKASAKQQWGNDDLGGRHVSVQGLGHVGGHLCAYLHEAGARLSVTDIRPERVQQIAQDFGATAVGSDDIYSLDADIFAPCALGAIVNDDTIDGFKVEIIAGAANNQLAEPRHGERLREKGILYAPDYVINAGGLINVYGELHEWSAERSKRQASDIYATLLRIYEMAEERGTPTEAAANQLAEDRIGQVRTLQRSWV